MAEPMDLLGLLDLAPNTNMVDGYNMESSSVLGECIGIVHQGMYWDRWIKEYNHSISSQPATMMFPDVPQMTAFEKNGLKLEFGFEKDDLDPSFTVINLAASNTTPVPMTEFLFQAAVPKTFQLQLLPPTGTVVPPNNSGLVHQMLKISNPNKTFQLQLLPPTGTVVPPNNSGLVHQMLKISNPNK
ncbi:AP1G1, partial [Cordylochernes scorpioides]